jgi:alanyl-tRNA synthetase
MTGNEIRRRFLEHFESREHKVLPSAPLVPKGDPSTLFISAGMQPLQPYYLGLSDPPAPRIATCQKCLRTGDVDEVGKTDRHNTFFEMLGNFAPTGDYFKETAIPLSWDLVTEGFGMPVDRLRVTIHPTDDQAYEIWTKVAGVDPKHITRLSDNWWGLGRGPCGPDSEIWWDRGPEVGCGLPDCVPDHCERFTEFWNLVFPQYDQQEDGSLVPLEHPAIDTGMGIERISYILQGRSNIFETDLLEPLVDFVRQNSENPTTLSERIVADHIRAAVFVIGDGVLPSNEGRGYVLRRLIRRAAVHGRRVGLRAGVSDAVKIATGIYAEPYPHLNERERSIEEVIRGESERFNRTIEQGIEQFEKVTARHAAAIPGPEVFKLHDTFGFPLELTRELAEERGIEVDEEGFHEAMAAQRERSRGSVAHNLAGAKNLPRSEFTGYRELASRSVITAIRSTGRPVESAAEGEAVEVFLESTPFYGESGGQVGDTGLITTASGRVRVEDAQRPAEGVIAHIGTVDRGEIRTGEDATASVDAARRHAIARHHSATHLLHKALRETLGENVVQKGSWVGPDHTTFDIPLNRAMTPQEISRVNERVMEKVRESLPFHESQRSYKDAVAQGAMHLFEEKYGDVVRVVCFGDWTCELCGGTHVKNSADVGTALIVSESSIGSGLRRIDMVAGEPADRLVRHDRELLQELARSFNAPPEQLPARIGALRSELKAAHREAERARDEARLARVKGGNGLQVRHGKVDYVTEAVVAENVAELSAYADRYLEMLGSGIVTVVAGDKFVIKVSKDLSSQYDATRLSGLLGTGGGRPDLVRGKLSGSPQEAFARLAEELD